MLIKSIAQDLSTYDNDILYSEYPVSKVKKHEEWSGMFKENHQWIKKEEMNNFNFRSENFINNHKNFHVIFSGCSQTFGTGLLEEELWAKNLYTLLNSKEQCSGYFNLATPGASIGHLVVNIFKYCKNFENPKAIFINLPNTCRIYTYNEDKKILQDGRFSDEYIDFFDVLSYQYYFLLEQYCNQNNIKLFSFSWHKNTNSLMSKYFKTFTGISENDITEYMIKKYNNNYQKVRLARDNGHLGVGFNSYWTEKMYDEFIKQTSI
jgi:hypothetical protein